MICYLAIVTLPGLQTALLRRVQSIGNHSAACSKVNLVSLVKNLKKPFQTKLLK